MKSTLPVIVPVILLVAIALSAGCKSNTKNHDTALMSAAGTLNVPSSPAVAYTPPPAPQPMVYDTPQQQAQPVIGEEAMADASDETYAAPAPAPRAAVRRTASAARGTRYTIKKGESLWSIAEDRYGNGNKWKAIAAANPRLDPDRVQAGQTIVLP